MNTPLIAPLEAIVKQYSVPDLAYVVDFESVEHRTFGEIFRMGMFLTLEKAICYALSFGFLRPLGSSRNTYNFETRNWNLVNAASIVIHFKETIYVRIKEIIIDEPDFPKERLRTFILSRGVWLYKCNYELCDEFDSIECYRDWKSCLDRLFAVLAIPKHVCSVSGHIIRRSIERPYHYDVYANICRVCTKIVLSNETAEQENLNYSFTEYTGPSLVRFDYRRLYNIELQDRYPYILVKERLQLKP